MQKCWNAIKKFFLSSTLVQPKLDKLVKPTITKKQELSPSGFDFIGYEEGTRLKAYQDEAAVWTIGIGHTEGFRKGIFNANSIISMGEVEALFKKDIASREHTVRSLVTVPINQNEFDALVSFEYNTGGLKVSTILRLLNLNDREGAVAAFSMWNKITVNRGTLDEKKVISNILVGRRAREQELFLSAV